MKALLARRFVCFAVSVALCALALLLGFEPVLLVVAPSGHEHQSHLHLSGDNLTPSRDPGYKRTSGSGGSCCMWSCCDDHKSSAG